MTGRDEFVYRSTTNIVIAVATWAVAAVIAVEPAITALNGEGGYAELGVLALIAVAAWEVFWRPRLVVDDDGVELVNVLRTVRVPWTLVVDVRTRWALTIVTSRRSYTADGAPAPGASAATRVRSDLFGRAKAQREAGVPASERPGTDSGDAAEIVRTRWNRLLAADRIPIGRGGVDVVHIELHTGALALLAVLLAATVGLTVL